MFDFQYFNKKSTRILVLNMYKLITLRRIKRSGF